MRRGMVPDLVLAALLDGPAHGYELMDRLESSSGGSWRPSPGSIYPLLQMFEDKGLVESRESEGRRVFSLTDAGREQARRRREQVEQHRASRGAAGPGAGDPDAVPSFAAEPATPLRAEVRHLQAAVQQVEALAAPEHIAEAAAIIRRARQSLYRLLAEQ
jgi:DNA-binding PadR family transcriptional regulator